MEHEYNFKAATPLVDAVFTQLPVMAAVATEPLAFASKPFKELGVVALLHLRPTLIAMVAGWIGLGLDPGSILVVAKTYDYPEGGYVRAALAAFGVQVASVTDLAQALPDFLERLGPKRFVVVEDGGHILPSVAGHPHLIGSIEQTTKGIRRTRLALGEPDTPVASLPASRFKCVFEPAHVARAGIAAIGGLIGGRGQLKKMNVTLF
jgi:hypothetical protein